MITKTGSEPSVNTTDRDTRSAPTTDVYKNGHSTDTVSEPRVGGKEQGLHGLRNRQVD